MHAERMQFATTGGAPRRRTPRLGVRSTVLLVVLVPTLAMLVVLGGSVVVAWEDRSAAQDLQHDVADLVAIVDARAAIADEELASSVVAAAGTYGMGAEELEELFGIDYAAQLELTRTAVDENPVIISSSELRSAYTDLQALRAQIDLGEADIEAVTGVVLRMKVDLDGLWEERTDALDQAEASPAGGTPARIQVLDETYRLLRSANVRAEVARQVLTAESDQGMVAALVAADGEFNALSAEMEGRLGPRAAVAWEAFEEDAAAQDFERTIAVAASVGLAGSPPPLQDDATAFARAFGGAPRWAQYFADLPRAAAEDVTVQANADEADATRTVLVRTVAAVLLAVISVVAAAVLAAKVVGPVQRLGQAAREVRDGRFAPEPLDGRGPRELAEAATAFNEMAATLASVEEQAVMLAEDPGGVRVPKSLPGRTGAALHAAFERLRASILTGEQQRVELHALASHDPLTGLLNRAAVLDALDRELAAQARRDKCTMVLFLDLDGLKQINDRHGHEAGDAALGLVAEALRSTTRSSDAIARYGGDEFLVVGAVDEDHEVEVLAERIRRRIATEALVWDDQLLPMSCSIGMAVMPPGEGSSQMLVRLADAALYDAKHAGRNLTAWSSVVS
jgi:diguanylate cyclase (GGDEF)-like protein